MQGSTACSYCPTALRVGDLNSVFKDCKKSVKSRGGGTLVVVAQVDTAVGGDGGVRTFR
jgi:hypothetical protein